MIRSANNQPFDDDGPVLRDETVYDYDPFNDGLYFGHGPEVGMFYDRPRHFDPTTGAWLSDEPLAFDDANLYRHVSNLPADAADLP